MMIENFVIEYMNASHLRESFLKKKKVGMIPIGNLFVSKIMLQTLVLLLVRAKKTLIRSHIHSDIYTGNERLTIKGDNSLTCKE